MRRATKAVLWVQTIQLPGIMPMTGGAPGIRLLVTPRKVTANRFSSLISGVVSHMQATSKCASLEPGALLSEDDDILVARLTAYLHGLFTIYVPAIPEKAGSPVGLDSPPVCVAHR